MSAVSADQGLPELYVYYKVAEAQVEAALRAYEQALPGLDGLRLLRREPSESGLQTWMEVHNGPEARANEVRLAAVLAPYISGIRQVECFVTLQLE